jgi:hypothetical protein
VKPAGLFLYSRHVGRRRPFRRCVLGASRIDDVLRETRGTCVCRAPPTLAVSVRASYPHRLGDGSNPRAVTAVTERSQLHRCMSVHIRHRADLRRPAGAIARHLRGVCAYLIPTNIRQASLHLIWLASWVSKIHVPRARQMFTSSRPQQIALKPCGSPWCYTAHLPHSLSPRFQNVIRVTA